MTLSVVDRNQQGSLRALVILAGIAVLVAGCSSNWSVLGDNRSRTPDPFETIRNMDIEPRFPAPTGEPPPAPDSSSPITFYGREGPPFGPNGESGGQPSFGGKGYSLSAAGAKSSSSGEGYDLNFENAPVTTVAKVILGDVLGLGYTIDPRIQGTVTIASGRPVSRDKLIFALENALRLSNVVLVPDAAGYRLIPGADAVGTLGARGAEAGYGLTIVPLYYASASAILKLLDSFALKPGIARADQSRNLILVQGTSPERRSAVDTILSFDVDWMRGQSVGVYPLKAAVPEAMISELEKVMDSGEGGLNHALIKYQVVARLNAVLVVSKKPQLLQMAGTWIGRLDRANNAAASVRVYRLRYGSAKQVAALLNDIFGGRSSGIDSPANEIAPGAGVVSTTSLDKVTYSGESGSISRSLGTSSTSLAPTSSAANSAGNQSTLTSPGAVAGDRQGAEQIASVAFPGVRISADVANNALLIFANQEKYRLIEQTLSQIDRPQLQVAINATIAEISLNNELRYGVQYFLKSPSVGLPPDQGSVGLFNTIRDSISRVLPGFNLVIGAEASARMILDMLRTITDVKVLSTPSVVVIDNQVATLQVGEQVPIATQSATILTNPNTPLVNTIDYRNTGVILRVLPRVNANGNVVLDIEQEISNVSRNVNANTLTPTVSQRKVKSSISVAGGQTVLLGGLIQERQERERVGIPVLSELPVIGDAVARNTRGGNRTELVIFIQPQVIRDSVDAYQVAEELRTKLRGSSVTAFPPAPSLLGDPATR